MLSEESNILFHLNNENDIDTPNQPLSTLMHHLMLAATMLL